MEHHLIKTHAVRSEVVQAMLTPVLLQRDDHPTIPAVTVSEIIQLQEIELELFFLIISRNSHFSSENGKKNKYHYDIIKKKTYNILMISKLK